MPTPQKRQPGCRTPQNFLLLLNAPYSLLLPGRAPGVGFTPGSYGATLRSLRLCVILKPSLTSAQPPSHPSISSQTAASLSAVFPIPHLPSASTRHILSSPAQPSRPPPPAGTPNSTDNAPPSTADSPPPRVQNTIAMALFGHARYTTFPVARTPRRNSRQSPTPV